MSLYAIKDEDGELRDAAWDSPNITRKFYAYTDVSVDDAKAEAAKHRDNHVVELVEKPEPVEVSDDVGKLLTYLRKEIELCSTSNSVGHYIDILGYQHNLSIKDIFHALDVGWTVKQPKRWYVKAPEEWAPDDDDDHLFFKHETGGIGTLFTHLGDERIEPAQFTAEEIERYRLGGFEKVGVTDHAEANS